MLIRWHEKESYPFFWVSLLLCWILKFLIDLEQFPPLLLAGSYDQHFTEQLNYPWLHCRHLLQLENLNCDPQGKFFKHYHHFSPKVSSHSPASTLLHKLLGSELKMSFLSPLPFSLENLLAWLVPMRTKKSYPIILRVNDSKMAFSLNKTLYYFSHDQ